MTKPEIINETPISVVDLKAELERIKKRDKELNFRSNRTYEYSSQIASLSQAKTKELISKLGSLKIPRLKPIHITKIADLLPTSVEGLKVILHGYSITVNNENMKKIVDVVKGFVK